MNQTPIIFFDGYCNLCSWWVAFVLKRDKQKQFRFCALQSSAAEKLLSDFNFAERNNSVVLLSENKIYSKSTAALHILKQLKGMWSLFYCFIIIPRFIRDAVYDFIARYRYKWFGKRIQCYAPTNEEKKLFIEQF